MPFPVSISGSIQLQRRGKGAETLERIGARIEASLKREAASSIARHGTRISFKVAVLFGRVSRWSVLGPMDSGTVEIEDIGPRISVKYCVSTMRNFVVATTIYGVIVPSITFFPDRNGDSAVQVMLCLLVVWALTVGGAYFVTANRFPRWLKRNLERVG